MPIQGHLLHKINNFSFIIMLIVLYSFFQWLLDYNDLSWISWQVGFFHNLFTTFVHVTIPKSMYHIVYPKEKKRETKVWPIPHHGLWCCYSKFTLLFQIAFFYTLFCIMTKLFMIDTWAFVYLYPLCTQLFSIAHEFNVVDNWRNSTFFLLQVICLTIWLLIWLSRLIS